MKRWLITIIAAAILCSGIWEAARVGIARTFAQNADLFNDRAAADKGVRWLPNDAETHTSRGVVLQRRGDYRLAVTEFERAAQLRPRDYFPWMLLGVTRDQNRDQAGAVSALRQSIALAPAYGKPHWLLGNVLLRGGQFDEAFRELRLAARSNPALLPNVIDLAWGISRHDPLRTAEALQPDTDAERLSLAIYFASHQQGTAALDQFRAVKTASDESANRLLTELLRAKQFVQAYEVWTLAHGVAAGLGPLLNGDFEDEVAIRNSGFGWQITANMTNVSMSLDGAQFQTGGRSLRVDFAGDPDPEKILLSQVLIVKPGAKYRLTFRAMTKDFVSAAPPLIVLADAADDKQQPIAKSAPLTNTGAWQEFDVRFSAPAGAQAIVIALRRQPCTAQPCVAFGTLWLDSFRMEADER